jgi:hypothetical protein
LSAGVSREDVMMSLLKEIKSQLNGRHSAITDLQSRHQPTPPATGRGLPAGVRRSHTGDDLLCQDSDDEDDEEAEPTRPPLRAGSGSRGGASGPSATRTGIDDGGIKSDLDKMTELIRLIKGRGQEGDSDDEDPGQNQSSRGLKGIHRMRQDLYKFPDKITDKYVNHVKEQLGITDPRQFWRMRDWSTRHSARFQRMRGMYRVYVMIGDILDHATHGRHAISSALLCQAHKAILQMALDGGGWESARLLWPAPPETEVNEAAEFGGSEQEMQKVQQYRKAVSDLKAKGRLMSETTGGAEHEEAPHGGQASWKAKKDKRAKKGGGTGAVAADI